MRDLGDFQTPPALVEAVLRKLGPVGERWPRVLEPTCGRGNFIAGLLHLDPPPREIRAFELQEVHAEHARKLAALRPEVITEISVANIFEVDLQGQLHWETSGSLLVLGNPPWVTNAELGRLGSWNLPEKRNLRSMRGIDAMTGSSNFDLAEPILVKLATELIAEEPTIAMLCKVSAARGVLRFAWETGLPIAEASLYRIDARKWFGATVGACLFTVRLAGSGVSREAKVYAGLDCSVPESTLGMAAGTLVADVEQYERCAGIEGTCPLPWRQGVKHDAATVMELTPWAGAWRNRLGETVDVEEEHVFPLLKGSDLANQSDPRPTRSLVVTQRSLADDTERLREAAPKLWAYLQSHEAVFARRKSSVFNGRTPFSLFGVGDYAFALYKVAVAGFYNSLEFRSLKPVDGRPVLLDDTCYFVACDSAEHAALVAALLNDPLCRDFARSLMFPGAKRPVTKKILQRIDLKRILDLADRQHLRERYSHELQRLLGGGRGACLPELPQGLLYSAPQEFFPK